MYDKIYYPFPNFLSVEILTNSHKFVMRQTELFNWWLMGAQDSDVNEKYALIVALREKFEMCYNWN